MGARSLLPYRPHRPSPPTILADHRWERHRHLGYAHFSPRAESCGHVVDVSSWRVAESRENALHSFFVGGLEEVRDLRAIAIPDGFEGSCLNKHGLSTNTSGKVQLRIDSVLQQEQEAVATARPRARTGGAERAAPTVRKQLAPFKAIKDAHALGASDTAADRVRRRLEERSKARLAAAK